MSMFWKNKVVLVTGHTGFKGSWLALWLQSMQAKVIGYSLAAPTQPNLFTDARVAEGMTSIIGDIRDAEHLERVIREHQPEIILHMAAQPLVRYSYENPVETYATNVMGTVNLLEAVRKAGNVKVLLNVTTDKCYENKEWYWGYRENEPLGGYDPYSNSKACSELVTAAYRSSFFNPENATSTAIASARAGNVIGGGDWALDRLIPDIMRACLAGEVIKLRYPNAIRPWQHVVEPLSGYLFLAQRLYEQPQTFAEAWNFGPNDHDVHTVSWIVENILKQWGSNKQWVLDGQTHYHEATYLKLDCSKARTKLGWQPAWDLATTLRMIVDWYQAYQNKTDIRALTLKQIQAYISVSKIGSHLQLL